MARHLARARQGVDHGEQVLQVHGVDSSLGGEDERGLTECERVPQAGQKEDWRRVMVRLGVRQGRSLAQTQRLSPHQLNHNLTLGYIQQSGRRVESAEICPHAHQGKQYLGNGPSAAVRLRCLNLTLDQ